MRAKWRYPFRARPLDLQQAAAVGMTRYGFNFDGLAAEGVRHIQVSAAGNGDAVAAVADMVDREMLNHGARR